MELEHVKHDFEKLKYDRSGIQKITDEYINKTWNMTHKICYTSHLRFVGVVSQSNKCNCIIIDTISVCVCHL